MQIMRLGGTTNNRFTQNYIVFEILIFDTPKSNIIWPKCCIIIWERSLDNYNLFYKQY